MVIKVDHIVITTGHLKECIAFYEKLGFTARDAGGRYELLAGDFKINVHILGHELEPHATHIQPGSADLCFEVDGSMEEYKRQIEEVGLTIQLGIVGRTGVRGSMRSIYLYDPDGNLVEFCSYEE